MTVGAAYVKHVDWERPRFFLGEDHVEAYNFAFAWLLDWTKNDRVEFEKNNGSIGDEAWVDALCDDAWEIDFGTVEDDKCEEPLTPEQKEEVFAEIMDEAADMSTKDTALMMVEDWSEATWRAEWERLLKPGYMAE